MNALDVLAQMDNPVMDRLSGLRQGFNTQQTVGSDLRTFFWFAMGVVVVLVALFLWARRRQRRDLVLVKPHPMRLFGRALKHVGVPLRDRVVLEWLARRCSLAHPAAMLVSADLFDVHFEKAADHLPLALLRSYARRRVELLRRAAFGDAP